VALIARARPVARLALQPARALRVALTDLLAVLAASLASNSLPSRDMPRPWLTPMPFQPPPAPKPPVSANPPQLEDHRFRQQLERRVLATTPDFTAGVMARLAADASATATPILTPLAPLSAPLSTTPPADSRLPQAPHSLSSLRHATYAPQNAPRWETLLTQVSVVGCIYAISLGIILGTSLAIAVIEPNMVLTALVSWINVLVGLITWLGMLTRLLLGSIGLLGVAYLLMLALLASLALVVLGAPRLVTTLWREA